MTQTRSQTDLGEFGEDQSDDENDADYDSGLEDSLSGSEANDEPMDQDGNNDSDSDSDSDEEQAEIQINLWDDVADPEDASLHNFRKWLRENPIQPLPPKPVWNNNKNPLDVFKYPKYKFNFANPPKPEVMPENPPQWMVFAPITAGMITHRGQKTEEELLAKKVAFKDFSHKIGQKFVYEKHGVQIDLE